MSTVPICRTCMSDVNQLHYLFLELKLMEKTLPEIIEYVAGVEMDEADDLPKFICSECISLAKSAFMFKEQCRKSEAAFKEIIDGTCANVSQNDDIFSETEKFHNPYQCQDAEHVDSVPNDAEYSDPDPNDARCIDTDPEGAEDTNSNCVDDDDNSVCNLPNEEQTGIQKVWISTSDNIYINHIHIPPEEQNVDQFQSSEVITDSVENSNESEEDNHTDMPQEFLISTSEYMDTNHIPPEEQNINRFQLGEVTTDSVENINEYENHTDIQKHFLISTSYNIDTNHIPPEQQNINQFQLNEVTTNSVEFEGRNQTDVQKQFLISTSYNMDTNHFPLEQQNINQFQLNEVTTNSVKFEGRNQTEIQKNFLISTSYNTDTNQFHLGEVLTNSVENLNESEGRNQSEMQNQFLISTSNNMNTDYIPQEEQNINQSQSREIITENVENLNESEVNDENKNKKRYACKDCEKKFCNYDEFISHKKKHKNLLYRCKLCKRVFIRKGNLHNHILNHSPNRVRKCDHCDEVFFNSEELKSHNMRKHAEGSPDKIKFNFLCSECGYRFKTNSDLEAHAILHSLNNKNMVEYNNISLNPPENLIQETETTITTEEYVNNPLLNVITPPLNVITQPISIQPLNVTQTPLNDMTPAINNVHWNYYYI